MALKEVLKDLVLEEIDKEITKQTTAVQTAEAELKSAVRDFASLTFESLVRSHNLQELSKRPRQDDQSIQAATDAWKIMNAEEIPNLEQSVTEATAKLRSIEALRSIAEKDLSA